MKYDNSLSGPASQFYVEDLVQRLEMILNSSALDYMLCLKNYMDQISITRTWEIPHNPLNPTSIDDLDDLDDLDTSAGLVYLTVIPLVYFGTVFLILLAFICYTRYSEVGNSDHRTDLPSDLVSSTRSNRRGKIISGAVPEAHDSIHSNPFTRSDKTNVNSIVRASIASRKSAHSANTVPSLTDYFSEGVSTSTRNHLSCPRVREQSNAVARQKPRCHANISLGSQSLYSQRNFYHYDNAEDDDNDDDDEEEDRASRESLRTSMESQKLLATGVVEIAPDDLYSVSENDAYSNHCNEYKGSSVHREICATATTTSGFENPSFELDKHRKDDVEMELFLEDPIGYVVDSTFRERYHEQMTSYLNDIANESIDSISTQESRAQGQDHRPGGYPASDSGSEFPTNQDRGDYNSNYNDNNTNHTHVVHNRTSTVCRKERAQTRMTTRNESGRTGNNNNHTMHSNERNVVDVGGALPPLPPSHHHRSDFGGGSRCEWREQLHNSTRRESVASLTLDLSSSMVESSIDSTSLSLPSSIARFHSSRVQPRASPQDGYPLASTHNYSPGEEADWSFGQQLDTSQGHVVEADGASIFPNRGSFSLSTSLEAANFDVTGQTQSLLESFEMEEELKRANEEERLLLASTTTHDVIDSYSYNYNNEKKSGVVGPEEVCRPENQDNQRSKEDVQEVVKSDRDPRMKRMMSIDLLKTGRVSVRQRLMEFGYIKPKGKGTYIQKDRIVH